jgi:hypothetical protein
VRVSAPECDLSEQIANLISIEDGLFEATVRDDDIACPVRALTRLEVSVGERSPWKLTWIGFGIGLGIGVVGAALIWDDEWRGEGMAPPIAQTMMWTLGWISVGTVTGNTIDRRRGTDHWEGIPLARVRFSLRLTPLGQLGCGVSVSLWR